jgi:chromosome segregation ATPase
MNEGKFEVEIENIKSDIKELKEVSKQHTSEIVSLKESDIELKVYVKQIFEKIDEMKVMIQDKKEEKQDCEVKKDDRLDKFIDVMLKTFESNNAIKTEEIRTDNEIKKNNNKQLWLTIATILSLVGMVVMAIFNISS